MVGLIRLSGLYLLPISARKKIYCHCILPLLRTYLQSRTVTDRNFRCYPIVTVTVLIGLVEVIGISDGQSGGLQRIHRTARFMIKIRGRVPRTPYTLRDGGCFKRPTQVSVSDGVRSYCFLEFLFLNPGGGELTSGPTQHMGLEFHEMEG